MHMQTVDPLFVCVSLSLVLIEHQNTYFATKIRTSFIVRWDPFHASSSIMKPKADDLLLS